MIIGHLTVGKMLDSCHGNLLHRKAVSDPYETGREKGREGLGNRDGAGRVNQRSCPKLLAAM